MELKDNLDIFICTHKDFEQQVKNEVYKVEDMRKFKDKYSSDAVRDNFYSEFIAMLHVRDSESLKKYVGFCHYRRYFSFMDDIPDMDELFKEYDCIVSKPIKFNVTVREQYAKCHNGNDLNIVENIIKDKFNDYYKPWLALMNGTILIPYNMFIMKREDFIEYVDFVKGVLDEYIKTIGGNIDKRIEEDKDNYIKAFSPNDSVEYQYRIGGFIAERLTSAFLIKKFKIIKFFEVKITETKYNIDKNGKKKRVTRKERKPSDEGKSVQDANKHLVRGNGKKKSKKGSGNSSETKK